MNSIVIVIGILTILMFDLGLALKGSDFKVFLHNPLPVFAGLVAQLVILPLLAFAISGIFSLPPVFMVGLVLIACCPGGSSSNIFSKLANGDVPLSVTLTALSSIITLFTIPFVLKLATLGTNITLPVGMLLVQNLLFVLVPLIAGMIVNRYKPAVAARIDKVLTKCAFPGLIIIASIYFIDNYAIIAENIGKLGLSVFTMIMAGIFCGAAISLLFWLPGRQRRTIVIEVGMQNAAQAIAIAASPLVLSNSVYAVPAIIYALLMNVVLLAYVAITRYVVPRLQSRFSQS